MSSNPTFIKKKPFNDSSTSLQRDSSAVWSFSKAERFKNLPSNSVPLLILPSTISKRFTTLGKGNRLGQTQNNNPPPDLYNIPSQFDPLARKPGTFFGTSPRRKISKPEIRPGPATYKLNRSLISNNKGVKIKSRMVSVNSCAENPAPNSYYISEKIVKKMRFNGVGLGKGKRWEFYNKRNFYLDSQDIPGPGTYSLTSPFDSYSAPVLRNKLNLTQVHKMSELEII